jgi:hypothetical protein
LLTIKERKSDQIGLDWIGTKNEQDCDLANPRETKFGMQCNLEQQVHSFIVDSSDNNLKEFNVFSQEELEEIDQYKKKDTPSMPTSLCEYLNTIFFSNMKPRALR